MIRFIAAFIITVFAFASHGWAELPTLRLGVLKFGTVNWELQTIKAYKLDEKAGFKLEVVPFAGKQATSTALHGGAVDAIVNDWIWVSRQRSEGRMYSFLPYSRMVGGLVSAKNSNVISLAQGFIDGIPAHWGKTQHGQAADLYKVLSDLGGAKLVGKSSRLVAGTFVPSIEY